MKHHPSHHRRPFLVGLVGTFLLFSGHLGLGQAENPQKSERSYEAMVVDREGIESEVKNMVFYWEEKVSETAFVPHEWHDIPVKKGAATIKVKFEQIKRIDVRTSETEAPVFAITLANGKTGEFKLAINGKFKGVGDFGVTEYPANSLNQIVFK